MKPFWLLLILAFHFFSGCVATTGTGGWPVQQYSTACDTSMLPFTPVCLSTASYDGGFEYRDQFYACKQSMSNYLTALDEYYYCVSEELKEIFNNLIQDVVETGNCYIEYFNANKEGDPLLVCSEVTLHDFRASYQAVGIELYYGVPRCVRKDSGISYAPQNVYMLEMCLDEIEVFKEKSSFKSSIFTKSAHDQYEKYMDNLRYVINRKADEAIFKFNCIAEGRDFCY